MAKGNQARVPQLLAKPKEQGQQMTVISYHPFPMSRVHDGSMMSRASSEGPSASRLLLGWVGCAAFTTDHSLLLPHLRVPMYPH